MKALQQRGSFNPDELFGCAQSASEAVRGYIAGLTKKAAKPPAAKKKPAPPKPAPTAASPVSAGKAESDPAAEAAKSETTDPAETPDA